MTDTDDTTLLDAVDGLTKRWSYRVHQPATHDKPARTTIVRHQPRLRMLEDAILTSTNRDGGGALARERDVMNTAAVQLMADYKRQINRAAKALDVPPGEPIPTLRRWYVATRAKVLPESWERDWINRLEWWAGEIDALLNPPEQVTIERPCPRCAAVLFTDKADGQQKPWPVRARKWDIRQHGTDSAEAVCMVCGARWDGLTAVRALAYDLEQIDRARHADEDVAERVVDTG